MRAWLFIRFCQAFIKKGTLDGKSHLAEVKDVYYGFSNKAIIIVTIQCLPVYIDTGYPSKTFLIFNNRF